MTFATPVYPGINLNENQGPTLKAVGIAFTVISGVTVLLRFVSRTIRHIEIERDDWLLLASAIFAWAYNAVIMVEADQNYYGQHIGKVDVHHLEEYLKGLYSLAVVYPVALTLSKLSLLALYWRIFSNSSVKRPIQVAAFLNIGWMIAAVLVGLFSCSPIRGFWDISVQSTCIQEYDFFLTNECLTIVLDLVVLLIPLWSISQIQRSLSQRISIGSTFALGLVVTIVSAIRLWQLVLAQRRPGFDPTFNQTPAALWAIVEINVWIVVANIPAMRPLIHDIYDRARASRSKSNIPTLAPSEAEKQSTRKVSGGLRNLWFETTHWSSQRSQSSSEKGWSYGNDNDRDSIGSGTEGAPERNSWTPLELNSGFDRNFLNSHEQVHIHEHERGRIHGQGEV